MTWLFGIILDNTPWWAWLIAGLVLLGATYSLWLPIWTMLPDKAKAAILIIGTGGLAYLAGRNGGAAGALERERVRNEKARDELIAKARDARERQRSTDAGGVRDDKRDPFRRD